MFRFCLVLHLNFFLLLGSNVFYNQTTKVLEFNPSPNLTSDEIPKQFLHNHFIQRNGTIPYLQRLLKKLGITKQEIMANFDPFEEIKSPNMVLRHGFLSSLEYSWTHHYPFQFKPVHLWLLILQGVAQHVNKNSEELRYKWVNHKGKKTLRVIMYGLGKIDWQIAINDMNFQIKKNTVKDTYEILDPTVFTHVTLNEFTAVQVTVMDVCQEYFDYHFSPLCGFPKIILSGPKKDWVLLKKKANILLKTKCLEDFGLKWLELLNPIFDNFINAYDNLINNKWWNSVLQVEEEIISMDCTAKLWTYLNGWIIDFFPYDKDGNLVIGAVNRTFSSMPTGISKVPAKIVSLGDNNKTNINLLSGFMGYLHNPSEDYLITPIVGWVIV